MPRQHTRTDMSEADLLAAQPFLMHKPDARVVYE